MLRILLLCSLLSGCAAVDYVFGPPVQSMTKREITEYCVIYPRDHVCREWAKGNYPKCLDCS